MDSISAFRSWRWCLMASVCLSVLALARAANAAAVDPAAIERALRTQLESERVQRQFHGATAAFVLPDGRSGSVAVGTADAELGLPMLPDSRMPAGSIGKTFVAALALALVADGRITLDDKLSKWLGDEPWYSRLPNASDIRLRHLLNHTSGVSEHVVSAGFAKLVRERLVTDPGGAVDPRELVGFILDVPPRFPVGKGYYYTDTGYILLQLALEKAGGFGLMEEVMRRFLYPLQLGHTAPASGRLHAGVVQGYLYQPALPLPPTALEQGIFRWNPLSEWAGGGFISNSGDLARWAWTLYQGRALPPAVAGLMVRDAELNMGPEGSAYGLGVAIRHSARGREWSHNGVYPGYRSSMIFFPDCRIAVAFQMNSDRVAGDELRAMGIALTDVVLKPYRNHRGAQCVSR
jgi:D-alanyl-D-alanine carboxypeptidase